MASTKKSILITGCTLGGIGNALAREFHAHDLRVFATARSKSSLEDLSALGIETFDLEVTSSSSVTQCAASISALTSGKLDYLVNNAGRNYTIPALDIDLEEVRQTFETNVIGPMHIIQVFSPLLIEAKGTVVQIGSIAGAFPFVFSSVYNSSKAALLAYSNTLRVELEPFGVKVVTVVTGGVRSRIARTERTLPAESLYQPIEDEYQKRVRYSQESNPMDTTVFAKKLVAQVLGLNSWSTWFLLRGRLIWEGNAAKLIWFVRAFLYDGVFDWFMKKRFGLDKLGTHVRETQKTK